MHCSIQTSNPIQKIHTNQAIVDGFQTHYKYSLLNYLIRTYFYWHRLELFNSNTLNLMMLWWLMKGCMGQRFCNAVVWIAELVRVKKAGN